MKKLTHISEKGDARMVDVGEKPASVRIATASGRVFMKTGTLALITGGKAAKGDVMATARIAGIMAAKKTPDIIPLCHPINLTSVKVDLKTMKSTRPSPCVQITATAKTTGPTGVEMEALTAVSAAALTIYDMLKAVDKEMVISDVMLLKKSGGRSGTFKRTRSPKK